MTIGRPFVDVERATGLRARNVFDDEGDVEAIKL